MMLKRTMTFGLAVVLVGTILGGCSGTEDDTGSGKTGIEFGRGEIPETVPEDFPLPTEAVINATLIDWDRDRTEVSMLFPAEIPVVARFFDENLPNRGYLVESSTGSAVTWTVEFTRDELTGSLQLKPQTETTTAVTLEIRR
jgi:hypothetical protein